ncbi:MAG: Lrp/AsnC family transcriptional regulator [Burkholderiales bacterium]
MDDTDRIIVNRLQGGFPICERPFAAVAEALGLSEDELIRRVDRMLQEKVLTRFGPMFDAEKMGGAFSLAAMRVPEAEFERIRAIVNAFPQVAHNYQREHALNMWFVLATDTPQGIADAISAIERATGLKVYNMPKQEEYFIGLRFEV